MLSKRQQQVAQLLLKGLTTKEMAAALQISTHTCNEYIRIIYKKLGVSTRVECVVKLSKHTQQPP